MVLRDGSGWVKSQDGTIEMISARSVVTWDAGDWIEYGSDGSGEFEAELYWADGLPEQSRSALVAEAFGTPD
jgi:hypothetical protein